MLPRSSLFVSIQHTSGGAGVKLNESFGTSQDVVHKVCDPGGTQPWDNQYNRRLRVLHRRHNLVIVAGKPRSPTRKSRSRAPCLLRHVPTRVVCSAFPDVPRSDFVLIDRPFRNPLISRCCFRRFRRFSMSCSTLTATVSSISAWESSSIKNFLRDHRRPRISLNHLTEGSAYEMSAMFDGK